MTTLHIVAYTFLLGVIVWLCYDPSLGMLNRNGGRLLILLLAWPCLVFGATFVFADVNRLKLINKVTGNHFLTNALLKNGFRVRWNEFAWQIFGDEFGFIIWGDGHAFVARLARQLAAQPLTDAQRRVLLEVDGIDHLSATFAIASGIRHIGRALARSSAHVLAQKAERDAQ